jgi:predicted AlkP superfamily pyrophosphatase or phosphodiesterase
MFWPGSEAEIHGIRPTYWRRFDGSLPASARVAQVLEWLALPESERPSFITLYFDDVDHAGHDYGPGTPQLRAAAAVVDGSLGTLLAGIERLGLQGRTTVAVSSDHGMASLSPSRVILLDDYIDPAAVEVLESGGFLALAPIDASPAGVEAIDSRLRHAHPHLRVFTQETIPARLHYTGNPRIAPIVGVADPGWTVTTRALRQGRVADGHAAVQAGSHGFDPASTVMHATFVTAGPDVRSGLVVPSLENVHLYNFLCAVLRIEPAPNDGDPERVSAWIRRSP